MNIITMLHAQRDVKISFPTNYYLKVHSMILMM